MSNQHEEEGKTIRVHNSKRREVQAEQEINKKDIACDTETMKGRTVKEEPDLGEQRESETK